MGGVINPYADDVAKPIFPSSTRARARTVIKFTLTPITPMQCASGGARSVVLFDLDDEVEEFVAGSDQQLVRRAGRDVNDIARAKRRALTA